MLGIGRLKIALTATECHALAQLFWLLEQGEAVAARLAAAQGRAARNPAWRRHFATQSRQEAFHARLFGYCAAWVGRRPPVVSNLREFEHQTLTLVERGEIYASIAATQIVLDGFGDTLLKMLDAGLETRGVGFTRLREMVLAQEAAHQAFGDTALRSAVIAGELSVSDAQSLLREASGLVSELVAEHAELAHAFRRSPTQVLSAFQDSIPVWLR